MVFRHIASGRHRLPAWLLALVLSMTSGCADLSNSRLAEFLSLSGPLDEATVATGLRQALDVGTQRAVDDLSAPGGFGENSDLRIGLPSELKGLAKALRKAGFDDRVDQLEDAMNEAAEESAATAGPIFTSAIASMTIDDAFEILKGPDDAATSYFKKKTSKSLRKAFTPVVATAMQNVGLYRSYLELLALYDAIPFSRLPNLDLEDYVADRTLKALFTELALEEARIREDPAARSTALLRRVFGSVQESGSASAKPSESS